MSHRDRFPILAAMGVLMLSLGLAAAFLGPLEVYCFYLFSEGGRFQYEGFRFGSFMFANIACQVLFYYLLAALFLPLGYGHLRARRWARILAPVLLWDWLVVGLPVSLVLLFMLFTAKTLPIALAGLVTACVGLSYPLVPLLLVRFYRSRNVRLTVETRDPNPSRLERMPLPVLVLGSLCLFYTLLLHVPMLMNGLFPLFGHFLTGRQGFTALAGAIPGLLGVAWGVFRQRAWAWWAALIGLGVLTVSVVYTLGRTRYAHLLALWNLPATEIRWLQGIPIQGYHLAVFVGLPLALTVAVALVSRRYFGVGPHAPWRGRSSRLRHGPACGNILMGAVEQVSRHTGLSRHGSFCQQQRADAIGPGRIHSPSETHYLSRKSVRATRKNQIIHSTYPMPMRTAMIVEDEKIAVPRSPAKKRSAPAPIPA